MHIATLNYRNGTSGISANFGSFTKVINKSKSFKAHKQLAKGWIYDYFPQYIGRKFAVSKDFNGFTFWLIETDFDKEYYKNKGFKNVIL